MDDTDATSREQTRAFLAGSGEVRFAGQRREEVYGWVEKTLVRLQYTSLDKGLASISVAHLYRLRNSPAYRKRNTVITPRGRRRFPSASGANRNRAANQVFCASTPYTREINQGAKACFTSMPSTK